MILFLLAALAARARVLLGTDEALALAFPGCTVEARTAWLDEEARARAERLAGSPVPARMVRWHAATCDGQPGGEAWFDTHRVRTLPETLMVVLDPDGTVRRVEVLSFSEPSEYLAPPPFYAAFAGRTLEALGGGRVRKVTGATLTSDATVDAVRRVLALRAVVAEQAR